jgi:hypothetical protein
MVRSRFPKPTTRRISTGREVYVVNRWLLEFDVRAAKEPYVSRHWTATRRADFLLRPDVEWPLSVDEGVWPSVFYEKPVESFDDGSSTIEIDHALHNQCKVNLEQLRTYYDSHRTLAPSAVFTAFELLSEEEADGDTMYYFIDSNILCGIPLEHTSPERPPDGSVLLGYDVADAGYISGLANCGYTKEQARVLKPVWAQALNSFGLLKTVEEAIRFRELCDRRVPEHAPFWIYALWRLPIQ